jgi:AraC family transcriptional activator of pobA
MTCHISVFDAVLNVKGFNAHKIEHEGSSMHNRSRENFYRICMFTGRNIIRYGDKTYVIDGPALFFGNPDIVYSIENVSLAIVAYASTFSRDFFDVNACSGCLQQSSLFVERGEPFIILDSKQKKFVEEVFEKIIEVQEFRYFYKEELIRNYINLLIHEALKTTIS